VIIGAIAILGACRVRGSVEWTPITYPVKCVAYSAGEWWFIDSAGMTFSIVADESEIFITGHVYKSLVN
jgi:hypothetical protein